MRLTRSYRFYFRARTFIYKQNVYSMLDTSSNVTYIYIVGGRYILLETRRLPEDPELASVKPISAVYTQLTAFCATYRPTN